MKTLQISAEYKQRGLLRKTLTFPVTEEMAQHIVKLFEEMDSRLMEGDVNNDPNVGFTIEGYKSLRIGLSIMDVNGVF